MSDKELAQIIHRVSNPLARLVEDLCKYECNDDWQTLAPEYQETIRDYYRRLLESMAGCGFTVIPTEDYLELKGEKK